VWQILSSRVAKIAGRSGEILSANSRRIGATAAVFNNDSGICRHIKHWRTAVKMLHQKFVGARTYFSIILPLFANVAVQNLWRWSH
jgi:hypothetical protein